MRSARHLWVSVSSTVVLAAFASSLGVLPEARAQGTPDVAEVYAIVKSLQARVSTLEAENRQAKKEAADARAEARDLRKKLGPAPAAAGVAGASQSYALVTKGPAIAAPALPSWGGVYAGAAFGITSLRARMNETDHFVLSEVETFPGGTFTVTETFDSVAALRGRGTGAIANLFLGYNFVVGSNFVLGAQVEGGIANNRVTVRGVSNSITAETFVSTPPGGAAGTTNIVSTATASDFDLIAHRWQASALARAGWLLDPADMLYIIGGYTYGRFEAVSQSFGLNGGTIGGGWERIVAPGWTLRAEGRYTKFQNKTVTSPPFSETFTTTQTGAFGTSVTTGTESEAFAARVSADMWSVWLGVTHYFN